MSKKVFAALSFALLLGACNTSADLTVDDETSDEEVIVEDDSAMMESSSSSSSSEDDVDAEGEVEVSL